MSLLQRFSNPLSPLKDQIERAKPRGWRDFFYRYRNPLIFLAGFLFDAFTIIRIDNLADILIQAGYLAALTYLLVYQYREHGGLWSPGPRFARIWRYNVEALHFFYGGLLSAYTILYFKSTSFSRSVVFFVLLAFLLLFNEMPQVRRFGYRLRLGLYAFAVASFLIYLVPIIVGKMGTGVFFISMIFSVLAVWTVAGWLTAREDRSKAARARLFLPAGVVFAVLIYFYMAKLIPPVPLSAQYQGMFHEVIRWGGGCVLRSPEPPFWTFWKTDSRPFRYREGDKMVYFARIFAPSRFEHPVRIKWERWLPEREAWETTDVKTMMVKGGRGQGFRGAITKENVTPGRWRVSAMTEDGRVFGVLSFDVVKDESTREREWRERRT